MEEIRKAATERFRGTGSCLPLVGTSLRKRTVRAGSIADSPSNPPFEPLQGRLGLD